MAFDLTKFDQASDADQFIEISLAGLSAISHLIGSEVAGSAAAALKAVQSIVQSIQDTYDGKLTFDQVRTEFAELLANLETNDAAADEALRQRFDTDKEN
jgi:hypothetical protein